MLDKLLISLWVSLLVAPAFITTQTAVPCPVTSFTCTNGQCIPASQLCDGVNNCTDGSDESLSNCVINNTCINGLFTCFKSLPMPPVCLLNTSVCNGVADCALGEDELLPTCLRYVNCTKNSFRCLDKSCIPLAVVCDGVTDCPSGLDEANCTAQVCPVATTFMCNYGHCINASLICNGEWDCRDGSDETPQLCVPNTTCPANTFFCAFNNAGSECVSMSDFCNGITICPSYQYTRTDCGVDYCTIYHPCKNAACVNQIVGYQCMCPSGFRLNADQSSCSDINECGETPQVCSQLCTNTPGSYTCSCASGYQTTTSPAICQRQNNSVVPQLYFGNDISLKKLNLDGSNLSALSNGRTYVTVFDFDWQTQRLFRFDITRSRLSSLDFSGSNEVVIDTMSSSSVAGIAVDWIHRKLYWTSTKLMGIFVSEMNGSSVCPIIMRTSPYASAIAVHPDAGYVFWVDWGVVPFIARVGLDGSNVSKLITTNLVYPKGLTIDYSSNRFFWVDGTLNRIEYANLDGSYRHLLTANSVYQPCGVSVFESTLYWSDWLYPSINCTDRYAGDVRAALLSNSTGALVSLPYDVKIVHPLRQAPSAVLNPCANNNGNCSNLCLVSPVGGGAYSCKCPQGMPILADGVTCPRTCTYSQFSCLDGSCIPSYYKCNGVKDCNQGEDEPANCSGRLCPSSQFQCDVTTSVKCLELSLVCDDIIQCHDKSDEDTLFCWNRVCQVWEFLCPTTNKCIAYSLVCDGRKDCTYGEDESPINPLCNTICPAGNLRCRNGNCVPQTWYCDVDDDCKDGTDEPDGCWIYRAANPCPTGYKICPHNYRCIPLSAFCNGQNDCLDMSDELPANCLPCKAGEFQCNNKHCIPHRWVCDFADDCGDKSDENVTICLAKGLYPNCTSSQFQCKNLKCINVLLLCDGSNQCGDGSDEVNCTQACPIGLYTCLNGQCIDQSQHCNGIKDCVDYSDEMDCPTRYPGGGYCPANKFTCNNTICISPVLVCDGANNCGDLSDETPAVCQSVACPNGTYQCQFSRICIPVAQKCDGIVQCQLGDDETGCTPCGTNFTCSNGTCINPALHCDYKYDCSDGSDELRCYVKYCQVCQQTCTNRTLSDNTTGNSCSCFSGYTVNPLNTLQCVDINECDHLVNNWCPQVCVNQKASQNHTYKCLCAETFTDVYNNGRDCLPNNGLKGTLVYTDSGHNVLAMNLTVNSLYSINPFGDALLESDDVLAMDVDAYKQVVYWVNSQVMYRAAIPQNSAELAYIQRVQNLSKAAGVACDWKTGNIYWTDASGVYVSNVNVYWLPYTLLNVTSIVPGGIVVNPNYAVLHFINTNPTQPMIMSMTMSGNQVKTIVSTNIVIPTGLAVDLTLYSRVFWADRGRQTIESCLPDGSDRTVHVRDDRFPYKLDVFAGRIYWSVFSRDVIKTVDQLGQGNTTVFLANQTGIGPIRFIDVLAYADSGYNMCAATGCSICLLGPLFPKCVCPDGYPFSSSLKGLQCNVTAPADYVDQGDPKLCICGNGGFCDILGTNQIGCRCPPGFLGTQCQNATTSTQTTTTTTTTTTSMPTTTTTATTTTSSSFPVPTTTPSAVSSPVGPITPQQSSSTGNITPGKSVGPNTTSSITPQQSSSTGNITPGTSPMFTPPSSTVPNYTPTTSSAPTTPVLSTSKSTTPFHFFPTTTTPTFSSSTPSVGPNTTSSIGVINPYDDGETRNLSIALPVVLISVFLICLLIFFVCAYRRGMFKQTRTYNVYARQIDDTSSISSYPSPPTSPSTPVGPVGFHSGSDTLAYRNAVFQREDDVEFDNQINASQTGNVPRMSTTSSGYDQDKKSPFSVGYDQDKSPEFSAFPFISDSKE